tara:strand:- start:1055 stop:1246 length:192 start_codon:yes stop_codon:yes gene_type:complete
MQEQQLELRPYQYEIEVGHSKSGSNHVVILKSLKVRSDDLNEAIQEIRAALRTFNEVADAANQ